MSLIFKILQASIYRLGKYQGQIWVFSPVLKPKRLFYF